MSFSARSVILAADSFSRSTTGLNQYLDALTSHGSYWVRFQVATAEVIADLGAPPQTDPRFSTFVLTQLFASSDDLARTGREEIGEVHEED